MLFELLVLVFPQELHEKRYNEVRGDYYVLDSRNGLFLCMAKSQNLYELFICNPIIKQTHLPKPRNRICRHNCLGLSFTTQIDGTSIITGYKLVIFHRNPHQFKIFSSETAIWKTHNINPLSQGKWPAVTNGLDIFSNNKDYYCHLSRRKIVAAVTGSGILHWITTDAHPLRVVAYNPTYTN